MVLYQIPLDLNMGNTPNQRRVVRQWAKRQVFPLVCLFSGKRRGDFSFVVEFLFFPLVF